MRRVITKVEDVAMNYFISMRLFQINESECQLKTCVTRCWLQFRRNNFGWMVLIWQVQFRIW